jgi:hypothetical protein
MNILYVGLARSIWLFDFSLLNPRGLSLQGVIDGLKQRYQFAKAPKNALDLDERKALAFRSGTFTNSKGVPVLTAFTIYNDGFAAETLASTDDSTEFLVEVERWLKTEFGLVVPQPVRKAYVGQIDFESDVPLLAVNPQFAGFIESIEDRYRPPDGKARHFDFAGISFWTEDANLPLAPAILKIERKIGSPFSSNHYFSQTPLETQKHIELLNELEQLLSTGSAQNKS